MKKCLFLLAAALFLSASPSAEAATGRVALASDCYVVVRRDPAYLERYTGARMYPFLPGGLRPGDAVSGMENTWGRQTWTARGKELTVGVEKWDVPAEEAMEYFPKNVR